MCLFHTSQFLRTLLNTQTLYLYFFYWSQECFIEGRSPTPIFDLPLETSKNLISPFVCRITPEIE